MLATQAYLQDIVDTVREPMLVLGADLRVVSASRSFYQTFGASPADTENRLVYELGDGEWNIPALRTLLEKILPGEGASFDDFEVSHTFSGLGQRTLLLNARKIYRPGNHSEQILLAFEDVTERRAAQARLRETDEQLRLLVDGARDHAILMLDTKGVIVRWSEGAERVLGWTEAEAVGQKGHLIFTPEDCAAGAPEQELERARETGRAEDRRWHTRKNGTRFFADGVTTSLRGEDGDQGELRGYGKVLRDATDQWWAEQRLRESEEHFHNLADNIAQLAWMADATGAIFWYNQRWFEYSGATLDEMRGWGWRSVHHPDYVDGVTARFAGCISSGRPWEDTFPLRGKDGQYRWFLSRALPIRDEQSGAVVRWFGTNTDVTEQRETEARLHDALAREKRITEVLQRPLTAPVPPGAFAPLDVATLYEPALDEAEVGGDFFDAFSLDEGRVVALAVGDVAGKGLLAAARAGRVKDVLRAFAREQGDPAETLARLNAYLCDNQQSAGTLDHSFVVLALAFVDTQSGQALFATAGAEPPLVLRSHENGSNGANDILDDKTQTVTEFGLPLGIESGAHYVNTRIGVLPGDTVLLVTDGITESRVGGRLLGYDGMVALATNALVAAPDSLPALPDLGRTILEGARAFGGGHLRDDACLLLARLDPK